MKLCNAPDMLSIYFQYTFPMLSPPCCFIRGLTETLKEQMTACLFLSNVPGGRHCLEKGMNEFKILHILYEVFDGV